MTKIYDFNKQSGCYSLIIMSQKKCIAVFYAHFDNTRQLKSLNYEFFGDFYAAPAILIRDFVNDLDHFILTGNVDPKDSGNPIFE